MIIAREDRLAIAAAANLGPSVHNIQPTRFCFEERAIVLLEDRSRRLFVGDPENKDNFKSIGAALEALSLELGERGLGLRVESIESDAADLRPILRAQVETGAAPDPLAVYRQSRETYRGAFAKPDDIDHAGLQRLAATCPDLTIIENREAITGLAAFYDDVSMHWLRDAAYRAELLSWMRLSATDPNYARDGLSAAHMALSPVEAYGAGRVLGPKAFPLLDSIGLAKPLIAESGKVKSAAGIALFHRPGDENEIETGRRFYRVWLEIERQGLALCPMSVLADLPSAAEKLKADYGIDPARKLVNVFRVGRRPSTFVRPPRARLPASELIV